MSGTTGLTGAVDTVLVLKKERGQADAFLYGVGRDIEEIEQALQFDRDTGCWTLLGEAAEYRQSQARTAIIRLLADSQEPMKPVQIARALKKNESTVRTLLQKIVSDGTIEPTADGRYDVTRFDR